MAGWTYIIGIIVVSRRFEIHFRCPVWLEPILDMVDCLTFGWKDAVCISLLAT